MEGIVRQQAAAGKQEGSAMPHVATRGDGLGMCG